jgi:hypothetical protein
MRKRFAIVTPDGNIVAEAESADTITEIYDKLVRKAGMRHFKIVEVKE